MEHTIEWKKRNEFETIVLLVDNHSSHGSIDIITTAMKNGIYLMFLPTNCTGWIQVLDLSHFQQVRKGINAYKKAPENRKGTQPHCLCII